MNVLWDLIIGMWILSYFWKLVETQKVMKRFLKVYLYKSIAVGFFFSINQFRILFWWTLQTLFLQPSSDQKENNMESKFCQQIPLSLNLQYLFLSLSLSLSKLCLFVSWSFNLFVFCLSALFVFGSLSFNFVCFCFYVL